MSGQASAEPTIGPTRLARSRTTLALSPGAAAPAAPANTAQDSAIAQRADNRRFIPRRSVIVMLQKTSGFVWRGGLLSPLHELLKQPFRLLVGEILAVAGAREQRAELRQ